MIKSILFIGGGVFASLLLMRLNALIHHSSKPVIVDKMELGSTTSIKFDGRPSVEPMFINTGPMYFPKWKKLKYWQPTKKNPNRR